MRTAGRAAAYRGGDRGTPRRRLWSARSFPITRRSLRGTIEAASAVCKSSRLTSSTYTSCIGRPRATGGHARRVRDPDKAQGRSATGASGRYVADMEELLDPPRRRWCRPPGPLQSGTPRYRIRFAAVVQRGAGHGLFADRAGVSSCAIRCSGPLGARHEATSAQIALAWVLRRDNVCAIPRATKPAHVRENREALDIRLWAADQPSLHRAFSAHEQAATSPCAEASVAAVDADPDTPFGFRVRRRCRDRTIVPDW